MLGLTTLLACILVLLGVSLACVTIIALRCLQLARDAFAYIKAPTVQEAESALVQHEPQTPMGGLSATEQLAKIQAKKYDE